MNSGESEASRIEAVIGSDALLGVTQQEGYAVFPDGTLMANCTNCARRVVELLGRGQVWGFAAYANPTAESAEDCTGHDFAVVDTRFIVDVWISLYAEKLKQIVFDLHAEADQSEICRLYGDPTTWERLPAQNHGRG